MSAIDFLSPLSVIPGFGPRRTEAMAEDGICTIGDLLRRLPSRYVDRSRIIPLSSVGQFLDRLCTVSGTVSRVRVERGRRSRLRALLEDETGALELLWFEGIAYLRHQIVEGTRLMATGVVRRYRTLQMIHPQVEPEAGNGQSSYEPFLPCYRLTAAMREAGIHQKTIRSAVRWCLANARVPESLPPAIVARRGFPSLKDCLGALHAPRELDNLETFRARLRYEELYAAALALRLNRRSFAGPGRSMRDRGLTARFMASLPFSLTEGQRRAIEVLHADAASPRRMHRLLQGDVGCGKTVVAFAACLPALASGTQVAWLAPTEILARQTYDRVRPWLEQLGFETAFLSAAATPDERRRIGEALARGAVRFVVGTHALLEPSVVFADLGMAVVDEQQRFGAGQRQTLIAKGQQTDFLLMTATPIPQTLAQALYGDLEIVTIRDLPAGRKLVQTHLVPERRRNDLLAFLAERIRVHDGRVFYVVPRIETDDEDNGIRDIETVQRELASGALAGIPMATVHGRMGAGERDAVMRAFAAGDIRLLIATSVVEVGVDVPGASVMVVENAECFGLSQLHQLRGRVGRGGQQAYCFLVSPLAERSPDVRRRLEEFARIHDGFAIADLDLRLRGPGEMAGLRQSGWDDPAMAAILEEPSLFRIVHEDIESLSGMTTETA